jgi:hypothetical protein
MSEENVENILQAVEAFNRQDADAFVNALGICEWEDNLFFLEGDRIYQGDAELREWLSQIWDPWESIHFEVEETTDADDRVLLAGVPTGRGKDRGVDAPGLRLWQVFWIANGEIARRQSFLERDEALEAAGLSE